MHVKYCSLAKFCGQGSLIPKHLKFHKQCGRYEYQVRKAGLSALHSLRHAYAQQRFFDMTDQPCPALGGKRRRHMTQKERDADDVVRLEISEVRLLSGCKEPLKPVIITALHTEFRLSELLSLTWDNIDFSRRAIAVKAGYAKIGESRSIPMNELLTGTLEAIRISTGAVFRTRTGRPYRSVRTAFENTVKRAEIPDFTFHDLRHTFASRLVMGGVDLPTVRELMGHKDISLTLRYAHLSDDHKQRAVEILSTPNSTPPREIS